MRHVAFLRAINVGGGRTIRMKALRQLFEALGFSNAETFIASGNIIFETAKKSSKSLERKISKRLQEELGYEVTAFIRTETELKKIADYKSFSQPRANAAAEFNILLLADKLDAKSKRKVTELKTETNEFRIHGQEIYWLRRKQQGKSSFSTVPFEKVLGKRFTIRSAKTIKRITLKLSESKHG